MGCVELLATAISVLIMVLTFPISVFICFKVVSEYERAVIFRMGRLRSGGARGPGVFFVLPCVDDYYPVDLRTVSFDVPPQEVLSKDSVTVTVDAVVYYRISDPLKAVIQVSNYSHSTRLLAATTLRNVLGTRNLSELLTERETISHTMQMSLDEATDPWGVKVERVEMYVESTPFRMDYIHYLPFYLPSFAARMCPCPPHCSALWPPKRRQHVRHVPRSLRPRVR